ncbi:MAG: carboxymuconolactone decarboxylase family protein [Chloroflexi bacterium]|nr:carboxymuconolactone decarboxylase family protein [Chloroflexota bacterium]
MTTEEKQAYLEKMRRDRGYIVDMHKIMVSADFDWVKAYDPFVQATYTKQRLLDRKTKELIQVSVETALRAEVDQIRDHIRVAIQHGASPREVLEAMECVVMPMGMLAFRRGLQAWAAETGLEPMEHGAPNG